MGSVAKNHASWLPMFGVGAQASKFQSPSRFTVIESEGFAELGSGVNWVTLRLQTSVANQDQEAALPMRLVAMSFQPCGVCRDRRLR